MSSAFKEVVKASLAKNKAKYPLLKSDDLLDWQGHGDEVRLAKAMFSKGRRGNSGYDPLNMFKAILLGQ